MAVVVLGYGKVVPNAVIVERLTTAQCRNLVFSSIDQHGKIENPKLDCSLDARSHTIYLITEVQSTGNLRPTAS
jgi:hypothetical protein